MNDATHSSSRTPPAPSESPPAPDLQGRAREYLAELRDRATEIEVARRLPSELSDRFARSGFYRMFVPQAVGGLETPPAEAMQTVETLAQADGASAWCVFIGATSGAILGLLPVASAREIFSTPETLLCGVFAPRGRAVVEPGGFRVDGQWQWGSGTQNADWILAGCQVIRDGEPELMRSGAPRARSMIVPRNQVEFLDTWYVSGLSGTGSTDFAVHDVFVPDRRAVGIGVDRPVDGRVEGDRNRPLYAFPQFGLLGMGIAAVALGLARAAIDELIDLAGGKNPAGSARSLAARATAQVEVARAEAGLRAARAFYYEAIDTAWQAARSNGEISIELRRDIRLATTHATQASAEAVDRMYHLAGGSSVYQSSPLQRIFRDVHVTTQHMMVSPSTLELTGRLFLGLETDTALL